MSVLTWFKQNFLEPILQRIKAYIIDKQDFAILAGYFRYGYDRVPLADQARAQWIITMPNDQWNAYLFSRTLSAFRAGGIEYRVYTDVTGLDVIGKTDIKRPPTNAQVTWQRLDTLVPNLGSGNGTERDYTEIPRSGSGAQAFGALLGSQDLRPQPTDQVFVVETYNNSGVQTNNEVTVYLTWAETPAGTLL
ncbi:hypothetical protein [Oceanospirillum phage vB_OliS_GJ44]|nr:hypothetical protein [Oceanospirillum phage vB_OliS_GJ44]